MHYLYSFGIRLYAFLIFIVSFFNDKAKKLHLGQKDVFRYLSAIPSSELKNVIWMHVSSLGEFEQGRPIIEEIKKQYPQYKIFLTFYSPSGYEVQKAYKMADWVCYLPLDTKSNAKRFLSIIQPQIIFFVKYEFWPNFMREIKKQSIPCYLLSAIFRPSQLFFKWYGRSYAQLLSVFNTFFLQDSKSASLINSLAYSNYIVSGDTRFDRVVDIALQKKTLPAVDIFKANSKLMVAGSTWSPDEDMIIEYFSAKPSLKLIIAPHIVSKEHISEITSKLNIPYLLYSEIDKLSSDDLSAARVLVVDCIGILSSLYSYASIAYIGGGFGVGIHNTLEAAVYGVPIVFGPNYTRFKEAKDLIEICAATSFEKYSQLEQCLDSYWDNTTAGSLASEYVHSNVGATKLVIQTVFTTKN